MKLHLIVFKIITNLVSQMVYAVNCIRWKKPARPGKIIWVSSSDIRRTIEFSKIVKQKRHILNGIILDGNWDKTGQTVGYYHSELFNAFRAHFKKGKPLEDTVYFNNKKKSKNVIEGRVNKYRSYYDDLYKEIKENGFKISKSLLSEIDDFKVSIASNGDFLFMTGKHRLTIARLIGDDFRIPVKVSHRHKKWQEYRDKLYDDYINGRISKKEILEINHPDLLDLIE